MKMSADQILELEVSLLIVKYGVDKVSRALGQLSEEDERLLRARLANVRGKSKKRIKTSGGNRVGKLLDEIEQNSPAKAEVLRELHNRFIRKTFLRNMAEVRRFLSRRSSEAHNLKSRDDAVFRIFSLLAELDSPELEDLLRVPEDREYSALGAIADQIIGKKLR